MLMLTTQNEVPKYDCQEILEIMIKEYSQIFTPNSNLWSFWGYDHPKYDSRNMEIVANKYALSTNLDQLYKDIIIPVYDLDKKSPRLITRKDKFFLKEISKGIISAPSYFVLSPSIDLNGNEHHFIDGGVVANCPAMLAVTHILEHSEGHVSASQFIIINIGTGKPKDNYPYTKIKDWGKLDWANNISTLLIDANSQILVQRNGTRPILSINGSESL